MDYFDYIESRKKQWIGRQVIYQGCNYTVVDVDYNGALLIDKQARFTDTTAIDEFLIDSANMESSKSEAISW